MIDPDILTGGDGESDLVVDGAGIPGLTYAISIHVSDPHIGDHLRRRHNDGLHILEWMDAVSRQPIVEPHGMRPGRESLCESELAILPVEQSLQFTAAGDAFLLDLIGERDPLPVMVERHQNGHVLLLTTDAELNAVHHAVKDVRAVQLSICQFVTHSGPGGFLRRGDLDVVLLVEAHLCGNDDRRAVCERYKADSDILDFRFVASGSPSLFSYLLGNHTHQCRCAHDARTGAEEVSTALVDGLVLI